MTLRYVVFPSAEEAQAVADAVWRRYARQQRQARGLSDADPLDMAGRRRVAITTRYIDVITAEGEQRAALAVDDYVLSQDGERDDGVTIDVSSRAEASALPQRFRDRITTMRRAVARTRTP